ncbi:HAD-IA family hydrolase [Salinicola sp. JS01]|uniref:HAD-IA family hydrolase n=1 Tax=Salinicola sp. JS01 TaxID=3050071 RepID=UPI00255BD311|nr:HAD-IA family hydrolase [Salinicola sp. JS01]WIX34480.1 HAD-IA family hydrolase [Salinicola sp. JS01]
MPLDARLQGAPRACRYRLVIFDWDGTLMDSAARIVACMEAAADELGWVAPTPAAIRDIIGLGLPEAMEALYPGIGELERDTLQAAFSRQFRLADQVPSPFFPGVREGMAQLRQTPGCRLAVATGKSRRGLDRVFAHHGCGEWFAASRTADQTRSKPHPQMLEELLAMCQLPAEAAVMVGDTEYDLEMARALGMDRVAVSYGVHARERLLASEPVHVVDDFAGLVEWLLPGPVREGSA